LAKNAALLLFFVELQEMEQDIIEQKSGIGERYVNIYSKRWLLNEIRNITNNRSSVEIISIHKTKDSAALTDQVLYVIHKKCENGIS